MDSTVSSWKTNLLLSSRTPRYFWVFALLLTLILHFLIIWLLSDWLRQKPKKPQFLRVEWLPPPQKSVLKKIKAQIPIPVPEETEEPDKLNDLIQKEPAEKLSMKMLKTAKKNPDSKKKIRNFSGTSFRTSRDSEKPKKSGKVQRRPIEVIPGFHSFPNRKSKRER